MRKVFYHILLSSLLIICFSCHQKQADPLTCALFIAEDNRPELEKVLEHYKQNPSKFKAACFLIQNMPSHFSMNREMDSILWKVYNKHVKISEKYNWEMSQEWGCEIDNLKDIYKFLYSPANDFNTKQDIRTISADWLIEQIDLAFQAWQENVYTRNLSFETFCNFILPYRFRNEILLDDSRIMLYNRHKGIFSNEAINFMDAIDTVLYAYKDIKFNNYYGASIPIYSVKALETIKYGQCKDRSWFNSLLLASLGMAVCTDFVPARGNRNNSHTWNSVIVNDETFPFEPFWDVNRWNYKVIYDNKTIDKTWGKFRLPKVFRYTFSLNEGDGPLFDASVKKEDIPVTFQNPRIIDVSNQYFETTDVVIDLPDSVREKSSYAYLCVFGYRNWIPVQWGKIHGGKASFKGMGRDIVYMTGLYRDGEVIPVSDPFYLTSDGVVRYIRPSGKRIDLCTRAIGCFKEPQEKVESLQPIVGSVILGINEKENRKDTLHIITDQLDVWENKVWFKEGHEYQYIDILLPTDTISFCEVSFYINKGGKQELLTGVKTISKIKPINKEESIDMLTDHLSATGFQGINADNNKENSLRFDLSGSYAISSIDFIPYTKSMMLPECRYKLFYWENGWHDVGEKEGNNQFLLFENVPEGTLYRLENDYNKPQKNMERIFMYEDGIMHWM